MGAPPAPESLHRTRRHVLDDARRAAGLSVFDLWLRYFELGGTGRPGDVGTTSELVQSSPAAARTSRRSVTFGGNGEQS